MAEKEQQELELYTNARFWFGVAVLCGGFALSAIAFGVYQTAIYALAWWLS